MTRYSIYCASFTNGGGTVNLRQLRECGQSAGSQHTLIRPGGSLDPGAHILSVANPMDRFATRDLATVFGITNVATLGMYCTSGHVARYQKRTVGGAFSTGADHVTRASALGFLNVTSVEADIDAQDGADCQLEYIGLSSDGTNPFTEAANADYTSVTTPSYISQFYLGGCWLDSTQQTGLIRARYSPGIRFAARRVDGGVFPRAAASSIVAREPSIELTFLKLEMISATIGNFFSASLGAALKVYFQRGVVGSGGRVAPATTSHLKITAAAGSWGANDVSVSGEDDATVTVRIMPTGTVAADIASAIP